MDTSTFNTMFNNPFGSKAWNQIDSAETVTRKYNHNVSVEKLCIDLYENTNRIDIIFLINRRNKIFGKEFNCLTEGQLKDFDITAQSDNRKNT